MSMEENNSERVSSRRTKERVISENDGSRGMEGGEDAKLSSDHRRKAKHSRTKSKRRETTSASDDDEDSSDSSFSREERKRRTKKHKRKKERQRKRRQHHDEEDENSSSDDINDDSASYERRKRKKRKKEKKHKQKQHSGDRSSSRSRKTSDAAVDVPTFGKYGILKPSDMPRMQRSFEVWLSEIKGIHVAGTQLPKYEVQNYMDEYREDYNTATLPHRKYYDYDTYEREEYQKATAPQNNTGASVAVSDERAHQAELRRKTMQKEQAALQLAASTMDPTKIAQMKHQKELYTQMQLAFKSGDRATYRKIKDKLEADD